MITFEQWSQDNQEELDKRFHQYIADMQDSYEHIRYVANSDKCREEWEREIYEMERPFVKPVLTIAEWKKGRWRMSKKQSYTPGPWGYEKSYDHEAQKQKINLIGDGRILAQHIAFIQEECDANARLIASAPDLLARLEDCAHQLRQAWACIEHIKEHAPDYERKASIETLKAIQMVGNDAEAAIAKATGGEG